jgi:hypothetical protein
MINKRITIMYKAPSSAKDNYRLPTRGPVPLQTRIAFWSGLMLGVFVTIVGIGLLLHL